VQVLGAGRPTTDIARRSELRYALCDPLDLISEPAQMLKGSGAIGRHGFHNLCDIAQAMPEFKQLRSRKVEADTRSLRHDVPFPTLKIIPADTY
jgi:hypothetical protein